MRSKGSIRFSARTILISTALLCAWTMAIILGGVVLSEKTSVSPTPTPETKLPEKEFTNAPLKPHKPEDLFFGFDQLAYYYRVPGEFTHRLMGDEYGFESMSFIVSETHPGGGPGLHVHDVEEAHVLLSGTAEYRVGDKTYTVEAPYIARVPAGTPHTFINAGKSNFNLIAVFASKHPETKRLGPNPLIQPGPGREQPKGGPIP